MSMEAEVSPFILPELIDLFRTVCGPRNIWYDPSSKSWLEDIELSFLLSLYGDKSVFWDVILTQEILPNHLCL